MKKIKIMLSAVVVLAAVGGALAFKATKFSNANVYCSTFQGSKPCKKQTPSYQTTQPTGQSAINFDPCGSDPNYYTESACNTTFTTTGTPVYTTNNQ